MRQQQEAVLLQRGRVDIFPNVINPQVKAEATTSSVLEAIFSTSILCEQALFPTSCRGQRAWTKVFDKLLRIQTRETELDSEDAPAPDRVIVAQAIKLCHSLRLNERPAPSRVSAGVNGTIYLEWSTEDDYFEIEVGSVFVF